MTKFLQGMGTWILFAGLENHIFIYNLQIIKNHLDFRVSEILETLQSSR